MYAVRLKIYQRKALKLYFGFDFENVKSRIVKIEYEIVTKQCSIFLCPKSIFGNVFSMKI